jgi:DNA-binding GntR family transcriptional regulator
LATSEQIVFTYDDHSIVSRGVSASRGEENGNGNLLRVGRSAAPLRERVLDVLRQAILDGRYRPGQRLVERELIELTGVSRSTIREALRELEAEGLVETVPQKGAIVVIPTATEARELIEVRAALEELAVRCFVERATDAQRTRLQEAFDDFEAVIRADSDVRLVLNSKDRLYAALLDGARNSVIRSVHEGLQARVRMIRAASLSSPGRQERTLEEMRLLIDAILRGDLPAAALACRDHLKHAAASGLAQVGADPLSPSPE